MPEIIGIDHIYIAVSDLEKSERFYDIVLVDMLDFRKQKRNPEIKLIKNDTNTR